MDREALAQRYAAVKAGIPDGVLLVAVSKLRSAEEVQALYDLGHRDFGENYPQELREKQAVLPEDIRWHFIGHLQRNKVKYLAPFVHLIHGVDSEKALDEIDKRAAQNDRTIDALLQVHIAREETKHGLSDRELNDLMAAWTETRWPNVRVRGLMGMASLTKDGSVIRNEFDGLAGRFSDLQERMAFGGEVFDILSMGMSGDMDLAIAAGSNLVRIGTAIFGERPG
ncbi:MAG: YggS family pyridoxal phosphate-dependent enzyme [Flavobacteriales bacterium]|nr:YggS family pyridoxal phosphate-dependent enzyme [Flavobacteriales bacterium]MCB9168272.1 YggS family pyridoxal phosphate-dependent enzyme [Flavobacteriales bacterium]